jgi:hypothetical protein
MSGVRSCDWTKFNESLDMVSGGLREPTLFLLGGVRRKANAETDRVHHHVLTHG